MPHQHFCSAGNEIILIKFKFNTTTGTEIIKKNSLKAVGVGQLSHGLRLRRGQRLASECYGLLTVT
jgi:hypothetical protein